MEYTKTDTAPAPLGHAEQAVIHGGMIYLSMQLPLHADGDNAALQNIEEQTHLVLSNIKAVLEASGSSMEKVLRITVYLKDLHHGKRVDVVYAKFFNSHRPARSIIGVAGLPFSYGIGMDVIAAR